MSSLTLKKDDILSIHYIFSNDIPIYLEKNPDASTNTKFSFMVNYNQSILDPIFTAIVEASKTKILRYTEFEAARKNVLGAACERNKQGQPVKSKGGYVISKDKTDAVNEQIEALEAEYKEAIEKRKEEEKEIKDMLQEELQVNLCQTSFKNFPEWLNPWQTKVLRPLATETDEEITELIKE